MQKYYAEKDRRIESERDAAKRSLELLESTKHKLELATSKAQESGSEDRSSKEVENLKRLLKCSSCNIRFKSHLLLRCMHCFW